MKLFPSCYSAEPVSRPESSRVVNGVQRHAGAKVHNMLVRRGHRHSDVAGKVERNTQSQTDTHNSRISHFWVVCEGVVCVLTAASRNQQFEHVSR